MIVIMGATGTIGSMLLQRLAKQGIPVRAVSRDANKLSSQIAERGASNITAVSADASNQESLRRAFDGADQLFLAMSNSPRQVEMEASVIHTAAEAGIRHIVKISSPPYDPASPVAVAKWHQEIEGILTQTRLDCTILRPYAFMQNVLRLSPTISSFQAFYGSMGDTACNFVDCRDIADAAAEVLLQREKAGRIYTLTGSEVHSYPQIAERLTNLLHKPIAYINLTSEEHKRDLMEVGHMPEWLASHVVEIQAMSMKLPESPTNDVKQLLGQEPRTMDAFLQEHVRYFQ